MFKEFKVTCQKCGWTGKREEQDLHAPCPICEGEISKIGINIDSFEPTSKHNPPKTISLEELMEKDLVDNMKESINNMGKERIWNTINHLVSEARVSYINIYLIALGQLEDEGNMGDNFPNIGDM